MNSLNDSSNLGGLPLDQEFSLPPDQQECIDSINPHGHHSPFVGGRNDSLGQSNNLLPLQNGSKFPFLPSRSLHEGGYHEQPPNLSELGQGSISTSPSSNASSIAFSSGVYTPSSSTLSVENTSYPGSSQQHHQPSQVIGAGYLLPPTSYLTPSSMSNVRPHISSIVHSSTSGMLPSARPQSLTGNPPHLAAAVRDNYSTSTPGVNRHLNLPRTHLENTRIPFSDTTRSFPGTTGIPLPSPPTMYANSHYNTASRTTSNDSPPFSEQEIVHEIKTDDHVLVRPSITAKVDKGFFYSSDNCWTCYRRNYFAVQCSYTLEPNATGRALYLHRQDRKGNPQIEQIQAMAMSLSAAVDGAAGKAIELVQHTPKRDKGPQTAIQMIKLMPTPPGSKTPHLGEAHYTAGYSMAQHTHTIQFPHLPLQNAHDLAATSADHSAHNANSPSGYASNNVTSAAQHNHTFERIQFKSATANNGKRRAQQQYYHLIVELYADVRADGASTPNWVKVAHRSSTQVVVRGRSPSHYQNEGPNSSGRTGGAGSMGGSRHTMGWPTGTMASHGYGNPSLGGRSYGGSMGGGHSGMSYAIDAHPGSPPNLLDTLRSLPSSGSSTSSLLTPQSDRLSPEQDVKPSYTYFPGPLLDAGLTNSRAAIKAEHHLPAVENGPATILSLPSLSETSRRMIGLETSRGIYPWGDAVDTAY